MNASRHFKALPRSGQDGIALVIVLGLLSVLVIMGVAFSITTRTERIVARGNIEVVRARQLVHTALNRVLGEDIPNWLNGSVYPPSDAVNSGNNTNGVFHLGDHSIYSGMIFIPNSLTNAAALVESQAANRPSQWRVIRDQNGVFQCEYSYVVVNCSGLLDAMTVGARENQTTPRQGGNNPGEIRFHQSILPEILPGTPPENLGSYRQLFGRFESVPELYYLLSSQSSDLNYRGPPMLRQLTDNPRGKADHLHVFSRFPRGYAGFNNAANTNTLLISGSPNDWDITSIREALQDLDGAPLDTAQVDDFIRVMIDYAEESFVFAGDNETEKFQRISSKPVPMINEVIVSNSLAIVDNAGQEVLEHRIYVTIETWYPFTSDPDNPTFRVSISDPPEVTGIFPGYLELRQAHIPESGPTPATFTTTSGQNGYHLTTFTYIQRQNIRGVNQPPYGPGQFNVQILLPGDIEIIHNNSGEIVDKVFGPWGAQDFQLRGQRPNIALGDPPVPIIAVGRSCNDPRINWNPGNTEQWPVGNPSITPGTRNNATISGPADELDFMYARRGPIESVGELGYLLFHADKPWTTVRLTGPFPPGYPAAINALLDRFTVHNDGVRRGLVNPNTRQANVLAAALWTLPVERYPGDGNRTLTDTETFAIANNLITQTAINGAITNMSHLTERLSATALDTALSLSGNTAKFERESVVRNSWGLLSPRHNLYTIYVAARTYPPDYNPTGTPDPALVTAEQRAVAVIWRDPYSTLDGAGNTTHQSWIQYFHWFSGAFEN
ncbi:MAG TPA: hypothetical protein PKA21_14805 [Kiritimatiellia bacterium]|nr:hypothetical protein [Kiritimatiellia bacterium]